MYVDQTTIYRLAEEDSELGRKVKETLEILEQVVQKYGCVLECMLVSCMYIYIRKVICYVCICTTYLMWMWMWRLYAL